MLQQSISGTAHVADLSIWVTIGFNTGVVASIAQALPLWNRFRVRGPLYKSGRYNTGVARAASQLHHVVRPYIMSRVARLGNFQAGAFLSYIWPPSIYVTTTNTSWVQWAHGWRHLHSNHVWVKRIICKNQSQGYVGPNTGLLSSWCSDILQVEA